MRNCLIDGRQKTLLYIYFSIPSIYSNICTLVEFTLPARCLTRHADIMSMEMDRRHSRPSRSLYSDNIRNPSQSDTDIHTNGEHSFKRQATWAAIKMTSHKWPSLSSSSLTVDGCFGRVGIRKPKSSSSSFGSDTFYVCCAPEFCMIVIACAKVAHV